MIAFLALTAYLIGWTVFAVVAMRALADRMESCDGAYAYCIHLGPHWRGDGEIGGRETWTGAVVALLWPILWLPALAFMLANRRPTPRAMQNRIAELEREAGFR